MLGLFDAVKDRLKIKYNSYCIDNTVFRLHYHATTVIFLITTILVTAREFIGENIKCISDLKKDGFTKVVESYCFFTSTFTVIQNRTIDFEKYGLANYMGHLGMEDMSGKNIRRHTYYQWVPFVLFGQAVMFYMTHLLWKNIEGETIKKLVSGLKYSAFAISDVEVEVGNEKIPNKEKINKKINRIKRAFFERIAVDKSWARWLVFCEILNVAHVILEFCITDRFLGKEFSSLGTNVIQKGYKALDHVFPKVTKCIFHKYGASGTIEKHDTLCIMALNIINEKIYVFLWFWFMFLFVASCLALAWRLVSLILYSKSTVFNRLAFGITSRKKIYPWHLKNIGKNFHYADWLLLKYLSKNMDALTFKELFLNISEDLEETKPLCMIPLNQLDNTRPYKFD